MPAKRTSRTAKYTFSFALSLLPLCLLECCSLIPNVLLLASSNPTTTSTTTPPAPAPTPPSIAAIAITRISKIESIAAGTATAAATAIMPQRRAAKAALSSASMLDNPPASVPDATTIGDDSHLNPLSATPANSDPEHEPGREPRIPMPRTFNDGLPLPRVLVFDLDYTLWPFWCDTHLSPPLKVHTPTAVKDRYGGTHGFYGEVPSVLAAARHKGLKIAAASRTHTPDIARKLLRLLHVQCFPDDKDEDRKARRGSSHAAEAGRWRPAIELFDDLQIYPGDKVAHVTRISRALAGPHRAEENGASALASSTFSPSSVPVSVPVDSNDDEDDDEEQYSWSASRKRSRKAARPAAAAACKDGMPYAEMLFFDDEQRNANTERERGVCFWLVRNGVTREEVDRGVWKWRHLRGIKADALSGKSREQI